MISSIKTKGKLMQPYNPPHNKVDVRKHIKRATGKSVTVGLSSLRPAVHPQGTPNTKPNTMNTATTNYTYNRSTDTYYG